MWILNIDGPIVPYVRTTQRQKWVDPRYKRYAAWKSSVRLLATIARWPEELDRKKDYEIAVKVYWKARARADIDNCCKAAMDALFKQDRRILQLTAESVEYTGEEHLRLELDIRP